MPLGKIVKKRKKSLFQVETVTIPVPAGFALLEDVRNDYTYPRLRPRQPTSEALAISAALQLSAPTLSVSMERWGQDDLKPVQLQEMRGCVEM